MYKPSQKYQKKKIQIRLERERIRENPDQIEEKESRDLDQIGERAHLTLVPALFTPFLCFMLLWVSFELSRLVRIDRLHRVFPLADMARHRFTASQISRCRPVEEEEESLADDGEEEELQRTCRKASTSFVEQFLCSDSDLHLIVLSFGSDYESRVSVFLRIVRFNSSSSMLKSGFEIVDSIEENNFTIYLGFFLSLI